MSCPCGSYECLKILRYLICAIFPLIDYFTQVAYCCLFLPLRLVWNILFLYPLPAYPSFYFYGYRYNFSRNKNKNRSSFASGKHKERRRFSRLVTSIWDTISLYHVASSGFQSWHRVNILLQVLLSFFWLLRFENSFVKKGVETCSRCRSFRLYINGKPRWSLISCFECWLCFPLVGVPVAYRSIVLCKWMLFKCFLY